jgi:hypothetical protein
MAQQAAPVPTACPEPTIDDNLHLSTTTQSSSSQPYGMTITVFPTEKFFMTMSEQNVSVVTKWI